ncbi:MAG: Ig-like domain-containing protein [Vicinamibacteria bacterium]
MRVRSFLPALILGAALLPSEAWSQCQTASASGTTTLNTAFASQTGTFTVQADLTPGAAAMDGGVGLSRGSQSFFSGVAAVVLFHPSGFIRARDASTYGAATNVAYTPGTSYRIRIVTNVPAHTYTAYVRPAGGSEVLLAQNYRFRPGQDTLTSLDNWMVRAEIGSVQSCNFALVVPDTQPPAASVTSPAAGAVLSGTVTLSASASDNVGVAGVQFLLDGAAQGAEDTTAPYALAFNTTSIPNGAHTVSARARDAAGNATTSAAVAVTVNNPVPDTQPPSVSVTSPAAGAVLSGTVTLSANASDNVGVAGVQFLLDGGAFGAEDTAAPYALSLDTTALAAGAHTVSARARDAAGNLGNAAVVGVTVSNSTGSTGSATLRLTADGGAGSAAVVSLGVPFAPGVLTNPSLLVVRDAGGNEVPAYSASLATWPQDGSQRSVLVAFRATLGSGQTATWRVDYGAARSLQAGVLAPNPDGPISAQLTADWYSASRVIGYQVASAKNTRFVAWETRSESALANMNPPWTNYGTNCSSTSQDRTYYDSPHAFFQRYIHRGTASAYRRARQESTWYRANQLRWFSNNTVAIYTCTTSWNPNTALPWATLRRMLAQGMLDDYLLTGDPAALAALKGIGEAYRQNLPALTAGGATSSVRTTERNMAWPMMGLASYYAVQPTTTVRTALDQLVTITAAWQAAGTSGAFEHDIVRPDPSECGDGPRGASPFMTSLLIDGLMDTWLLTGDSRIPGVVTRAAEWYRDDARTSDGEAFQYLWGCNDVDYVSDSSYADLNILISHVFGAAYHVSGDLAWLAFGDEMAQHGVDNYYGGRPKQWTQSSRTFMKYIGYRSQGLTP